MENALVGGDVVDRDRAQFEKPPEAFPAPGHVTDRASQVVLETQRL